jgi:hypothetical protein
VAGVAVAALSVAACGGGDEAEDRHGHDRVTTTTTEAACPADAMGTDTGRHDRHDHHDGGATDPMTSGTTTTTGGATDPMTSGTTTTTGGTTGTTGTTGRHHGRHTTDHRDHDHDAPSKRQVRTC